MKLLLVLLLAVCTALPSFGQATAQQQMFVLKTLRPNVQTVGLLISPQLQGRAEVERAARLAAQRSQISLVIGEVGNLGQVGPVYRQLVRDHRVNAVWVLTGDAMFNDRTARSFVIEQAARSGIVLLAPDQAWVQQGAAVAVQSAGDQLSIFVNERLSSSMSFQVSAPAIAASVRPVR